KDVAHSPDQETAPARLDAELADTAVHGLRTNIEILRLLLADPDVQAGHLDTHVTERRLDDFAFADPPAVGHIAAAPATQDAPGTSPWTSRSGWRMDGSRRAVRVTLDDRGTRHMIDLDADAETATVGGGDSIRVVGLGGGLFEIDGATSRVTVARDG